MKKTINLPQNYLDAMKELLKEDYEDYLASFEEKRLYGLRINTLKISVEDFLKISPFELEPIPWIENGFYFHEGRQARKAPVLFCRTVLHSGAIRNDTGKCTAGRRR